MGSPSLSESSSSHTQTQSQKSIPKEQLVRAQPWSKIQVSPDELPDPEVINGVASIQIPAEMFADPDPLWQSFVVGYFIGDAPHVGTIHATVNRLWSTAGGGKKIDVQFIEKNTVLFRIENSHMRTRVIRRRYWHISDTPLVVNEWSPATASSPPDLSSMPLWVDLKDVPHHLFSHKGLKYLAGATGRFVRLHPNTERCTRLDVARVLVEVNLHKPLVEKISFKDKDGTQVEMVVNYPWLPMQCNLCHKWGHNGSACSAKNLVILRKENIPEVHLGTGKDSDAGLNIVNDNRNMVSQLLHDLEVLPVNTSSDVSVEGKAFMPIHDLRDHLEIGMEAPNNDTKLGKDLELPANETNDMERGINNQTWTTVNRTNRITSPRENDVGLTDSKASPHGSELEIILYPPLDFRF